MVKQTQSKENNKVKQTQQITDGSKPTDSQKKKKKKLKPKPNILKSETNGRRNQTLIDVERKKET